MIKFKIKKVQKIQKFILKKNIVIVKKKKAKTILSNIKAQTKAENICLQAIKKHPNAIVAWYLICCYAYYIRNISIVSDTFFDLEIVQKLKKNWDSIKHPHKKYLGSKQDLYSAYQLKDKDYPTMVKGATVELISYIFNGRL